MPRRKRRNHSPAFKAKVALATARGDHTLAELTEQFDVHANQIQEWKKRLMAGAEHVFSAGAVQAAYAGCCILWAGRRKRGGLRPRGGFT